MIGIAVRGAIYYSIMVLTPSRKGGGIIVVSLSDSAKPSNALRNARRSAVVDISKCSGETDHHVCPIKHRCYRYTSDTGGQSQSWIEAPYDHETGEFTWKGDSSE